MKEIVKQRKDNKLVLKLYKFAIDYISNDIEIEKLESKLIQEILQDGNEEKKAKKSLEMFVNSF